MRTNWMLPTSPTTGIPTNPANQGPSPGQSLPQYRLPTQYGTQGNETWQNALAQLMAGYGGQSAAGAQQRYPLPTQYGTPPTAGGTQRNTGYLDVGNPETWEYALAQRMAGYGAPTEQQNRATAFQNYTPPQGPIQTRLNQVFGQGPGALTPQAGPVQQLYQNLLGRGPQAFTPQAGPTQNLLSQILGLGPEAVTAQAGPMENFISALFGRGMGSFTPQAGPNEQALTNLINQGPQNLTLPRTQGEDMLSLFLNDPTLNSLSQGQIPAGILAQFNDQIAQARANTLEQFGQGGGRFGSDVAENLMRQETQGRNTLLANAEQAALQAQQLRQGGANALGELELNRYAPALTTWGGLADNLAQGELARSLGGQNIFGQLAGMFPGLESERTEQGLSNFLGLGSNLTGLEANQTGQGLTNLLGSLGQLTGLESNQGLQGLQNFLNLGSGLYQGELGQGEAGMNRWFQEYLQNSGLPPELLAILQLAGLSGQAGTQTGTVSGGGGSLFSQIAGPLTALGLMGATGGTSGLFGGTFGNVLSGGSSTAGGGF